LHKGGAKECFAFGSVEMNTEGFFECLTNGLKLRQVGGFDARTGIAGIGSQKPSYIFGVSQGRVVAQNASQKLAEAFVLGGGGCGIGGQYPKRFSSGARA
jgi:hypothetical protein